MADTTSVVSMTASSAATPTPIDPTTTSAWSRLEQIKESFTPDLRAWFAADADRATRFTRQLADLHVDLSKNLLTDELLAALVQLAEETKVLER